MPEDSLRISRCNCKSKNKKNILHILNSLSYCLICSTFIFKNITSFNSSLKVIKPDNFVKKEENPQNLLWLAKDISTNFILKNKKEYNKIRPSLIKNMKKICSFFSLSLKVYFSSIEYLDKICHNLYSFDKNTLNQISLFCIILATKFFENKQKAFEVEAYLKEKASKNYKFDEIYTLKLLNYDLNICTSYDMVMDILYLGFVFDNEEFNHTKLKSIYNNIPKILYIFSESNSYIKLTSKQIAICMVGFFRELLGLNPFSEVIQKIFKIDNNNINIYISGLNMIKKRIKIENEKKEN